MNHHMSEQSTVNVSGLPPKKMFLLGFVGGILALCTLGFFVLLGMTLRGTAGSETKTTDAPNRVAVAEPTKPAPVPPGGQGGARGGTPPPVTDSDHIKGSKNAKITLIEYSDFECPFCQRFHPTAERLVEDFAGEVRWVYRHFPLSSHSGARQKAEGSECAAEIGGTDGFWAFTDTLFARGPSFPVGQLASLAAEIGIDKEKFESCLSSGRYAAKVQESFAGGSAAGVTGTPGSFLVTSDGRSQLVPGAVPYEQLRAAVESLL